MRPNPALLLVAVREPALLPELVPAPPPPPLLVLLSGRKCGVARGAAPRGASRPTTPTRAPGAAPTPRATLGPLPAPPPLPLPRLQRAPPLRRRWRLSPSSFFARAPRRAARPMRAARAGARPNQWQPWQPWQQQQQQQQQPQQQEQQQAASPAARELRAAPRDTSAEDGDEDAVARAVRAGLLSLCLSCARAQPRSLRAPRARFGFVRLRLGW